MNTSLLLAYWGLTLLLIVIPGPDWAFVLGAATGRRAVGPAVAGLAIGYLLLTAVVAGGVGVAVGRSPVILTALTLVGAGYLIWLGAGLLRRPAAGPVAAQDSSVGRSVLVRGIGVSALNPKALLAFAAMLPQFVDPAAAWPAAVQLGTLGLVWVGSCAGFYLVLGRAAGRVLGTRPRWAAVMSRVSGAAMLVVAIGLVVERGTAVLGG